MWGCLAALQTSAVFRRYKYCVQWKTVKWQVHKFCSDYFQGKVSKHFRLTVNIKFKLNHKPLVQILYIHGDHWITISNLQCEDGKILIYDSVFNTVGSQVRQLVENICGSEININIHDKMPKQAGTTNCGVFAIATGSNSNLHLRFLLWLKMTLKAVYRCVFY